MYFNFLGFLGSALFCFVVAGLLFVCFVEVRQNDIFVSSMKATITSQYCEQLRIVRLLLLVFLRNIALVSPKANNQFRNISQSL